MRFRDKVVGSGVWGVAAGIRGLELGVRDSGTILTIKSVFDD